MNLEATTKTKLEKIKKQNQIARLSSQISSNISATAIQNVEIKDIQEYTSHFKDPTYAITEKNLKIPVLIYHAFDKKIPKNDTYQIYVTDKTFEENIKTILEEGYTFISFDDLYQYKKGELKLPERIMILTIDDGYKNNYDIAFPIIQKYNIKANIFIITNARGEDYLSWDEIRQMHKSGLISFYSHGSDHIDYTSISTTNLKKEILNSHNELEKQLDQKILKVFAYPSGKHNKTTINTLKSVGFEIQVLTKYGTVNKSRTLDLTDIGRIRVNNNTTGKSIINIINKTSY